jgi:hypothetical protein
MSETSRELLYLPLDAIWLRGCELPEPMYHVVHVPPSPSPANVGTAVSFLLHSNLLLDAEGWNAQVKVPRMSSTIQVETYQNNNCTQGYVDVTLKYNIAHSWRSRYTGPNYNVCTYYCK